MSVREATVADRAAVLRLDRDVVATDDRQPLLDHAIRAGECMVCEHDDRIVGYVIMKQRHFYGRDFIELVVVATDARRQGAGRSLLRAAIGASTTPEVFTSTNTSNTAMQALLASEEWSLSGQLTGLDADDPELVYYRKSA